MANNEKKESLQWLKALMGKPDPEADTILNIQAKIFRQGMLKDRKREKETIPIADERLYQNIKSNLQNQGLLAKSKKGLMESYIERKKEALKLFITAFIALLVGTMIPIQIATRGESLTFIEKVKSVFSEKKKPESADYLYNPVTKKIEKLINNEIVLKDINPNSLAHNIITSAMSARLESKISKDKEIHIIIYGLEKNRDDQIALKALLGLSIQDSGNVRVTIKIK
jgi:hypothetical protein